MYLSQSQQKKIKSLTTKKNRQKLSLFRIDRKKIVLEAINENTFPLEYLLMTQDHFDKNDWGEGVQGKIIIASQKQLNNISNHKNQGKLIGVFKTLGYKNKKDNEQKWEIGLWDVQDPSNFGAILRIADWYNINQVICSSKTVDLFNPKVIDASMGSFLRVNVQYTEMYSFLTKYKLPIYKTQMNGRSIYEQEKMGGLILIGNESNGIPIELVGENIHEIGIPKIGSAESLNASVACGIVVDRLVGNC